MCHGGMADPSDFRGGRSMIFDILKRQDYVLIAEIGVNYYDIAKKESNISIVRVIL